MASTNEEILIKLKALDELTPVMLKALQSMEQTTSKMSQALDEVGTSSKKTADATEGLHGGIITLSAGFLAVKGAAEAVYGAFEKVSEFLGHAIEESIEAEKSFNRMQGALISTGQYTAALTKELNEYAESVQESTGASAETIKNIIATGVQMGLTTEKAQELEEASRKLAAATGESLESAFSTMQSSLAGQSRALGKVLPEVKELSAAQLKNGDAIEIVNRALTAQYTLYQGSYSAALERAKAGVGDVYKEIGNLITQSPIVIGAINLFTKTVMTIADNLAKFNVWVKENQTQLIAFGKALGIAAIAVGAVVATIIIANTVIPIAVAVFGALATSVSLYGIAGTIAANATALLSGAIAVLTAPVSLVIIAVVALTAALYKWPGLFDVIAGAIKGLIGLALVPLSLAFGAMTAGIGAVVSLFNKDLGQSITSAGEALQNFRDDLIITGIEQAKMGVASIQAGKDVKSGADMAADALEKEKIKASEAAKAHQELIQTYDGFSIGTAKQRQQLELQVSQRDEELKKFTQYLDERKRLAISNAEEQEAQVNKVRADALKGAGGSGKIADGKVEVDNEAAKQANLKVLRDEGILNMEQYNSALLASVANQQAVELQMGLAHANALADALGTSEAAFQLKLQTEDARFQVELQNRIARAQEEGATEDQIYQLKQSALEDSLAKQNAAKEAFIQDDIKRAQQNGDTGKADQKKIELAQQQHGKILGALVGVQETQTFKTTQGALNDLSSLRSSKSKEAFEIGKKAAIAEATINTYRAATAAYASLAGIAFVGPVLGGIAAAAAIAAGFVQIQNINAQQFSQAHGGLDEVPAGMDNSTFLLKGGERVVQPEANKDLTTFLANQVSNSKDPNRDNASASAPVYNITLNYQGDGNPQDGSKMADIIIEQIRSRSERGQPILSSKGVVQE